MLPTGSPDAEAFEQLEHALSDETRMALLLVGVDPGSSTSSDSGSTLARARIEASLRPELRNGQPLISLRPDEYAVVLPQVGRKVAERVAQNLLTRLDDEHNLSASVGIAVSRVPYQHSELYDRARRALDRARSTRGGIVHFADLEGARLPPPRELHQAVAQGELLVHLQPQVDLQRKTVGGAEALARWRHPDDGVLLPVSFLTLAVAAGLMSTVVRRLLQQTVDAAQLWWPDHEVPVSLNLTPQDLLDEDLTALIPASLNAAGLPPRALRIEVTEEIFMSDPGSAIQVLTQWRQQGILIALDDFGTGFSSLAYLRRLPLDELKLDQVFVRDLRRPSTTTIVKHTVAMAHDLGMTVVAEGVEDAETAEHLAELGCDIGQGLYFGEVMPPEQFRRFLDEYQDPSERS